ncbi:hypothetical protein CHS0354_028745 [Potamilus streckersoni]|uniref:Cytochrome P450 n=1 Tax=Potamilus streckersoni TaxID=2493646 RepID=A0AAE0S8Z7_9BIVA|nr:hypothetical protein CHS0354_028745 [Potamilus streckersoni]
MAAVDTTLCGIKIPKGLDVSVSIPSLHYDSKYWENPQKFDPDRFSPENKGRIHPFTFLPFGGGPRNCIGMRLALMETKMAIAALFQNFRILTSPETERYRTSFIHTIFTTKNKLRNCLGQSLLCAIVQNRMTIQLRDMLLYKFQYTHRPKHWVLKKQLGYLIPNSLSGDEVSVNSRIMPVHVCNMKTPWNAKTVS